MTQLLDGKLVAKHIRQQIADKVSQAINKGKRAPGLAVVMIGDNPASQIYVKNKRKACQEAGIHSFAHDLPADTSEQAILQLITQLNHDPNVDGILVQLPLPDRLNEENILEAISPEKDVDGFHPYNLGRLAQRRPSLRPCTPHGIMQLLQYYQIDCKAKHAVIVGASNIVGRPMGLELLIAGATVTTCHRFTNDLQKHVRDADLLIIAVGKRDVVKTDWIKAQAVVIDVGIHRLDDGTVCGDLDVTNYPENAAWITPVPGGVGPMTIASLLDNTWQAYALALGLS